MSESDPTPSSPVISWERHCEAALLVASTAQLMQREALAAFAQTDGAQLAIYAQRTAQTARDGARRVSELLPEIPQGADENPITYLARVARLLLAAPGHEKKSDVPPVALDTGNQEARDRVVCAHPAPEIGTVPRGKA